MLKIRQLIALIRDNRAGVVTIAIAPLSCRLSFTAVSMNASNRGPTTSSDLQCAEHAEIQLRRTRHENKHAVALRQYLSFRSTLANRLDCLLSFPRNVYALYPADYRCNEAQLYRLLPIVDMSIDRFVGHIDFPVACPTELTLDLVPSRMLFTASS